MSLSKRRSAIGTDRPPDANSSPTREALGTGAAVRVAAIRVVAAYDEGADGIAERRGLRRVQRQETSAIKADQADWAGRWTTNRGDWSARMPDAHLDRNELRRQCVRYAEKYGHRPDELERGLEAFAVHVFAQEDGYDRLLDGERTDDADLGDYILRTNDLEIDGYLEDPVGKKIMLVQAAWRSGQKLETTKLEAFLDCPHRLLHDEFVLTGGDQIQELLSDFPEKVRDGYDVELRFVTNVPTGENPKLAAILDAKNAEYESSGSPFTCELFGLAELAARVANLQNSIQGGFVGEVTISIQADRLIEIDDPYPTLIGMIKANELVGLYRQKGIGSSLFNLNIRLPLTSRKVNPAISDTAQSPTEARNFFYYNNGVSAVCSEFQRTGSQITAKRLQIINGAQTVSALVSAARRHKEGLEAYVLFRLTETDEPTGGAFTDKIIKYNNTQNPVRAFDFFANDPIQVWLRNNLTELSGHGPVPKFYYQHKSGTKADGRGGKALRVDTLAGIRHSFLYGPVASYREPVQFFDRAARYWQAFGEDGLETTSWSRETLNETAVAIAVVDRIQSKARGLKANPKFAESSEPKYLYRLARYVGALAGHRLRATREGTFEDWGALIASTAQFDKYVDPAIQAARRLVSAEWNRRLEASRGVQPEYNLARDDDTWNRLSRQIVEEALIE